MIDLDAIKARLAAVHTAGASGITARLADHGIRVIVQMQSWEGNTAHDADAAVTTLLGHAHADIAALIAEVELLRGEQVRIMLGAERHRCIADEAIERIESAEAERAAVVAWLLRNHYDDTAERIERGEHRREEKE